MTLIWRLFESNNQSRRFQKIKVALGRYYMTFSWLLVIIWWLFDDYLWAFKLGKWAILPYSRVWDYLRLIRDYCKKMGAPQPIYWSTNYLLTNNYQINHVLSIWWVFYGLFDSNNPNNPDRENKMWLPRPYFAEHLTHYLSHYLIFRCLFEDDSMIIGWLLDDYWMIMGWLLCLLEIFDQYL